MSALFRSLVSVAAAAAFAAGALCGPATTAAAEGEPPPAGNHLTGTYRQVEDDDERLSRRILSATARLDAADRERQSRLLLRMLRAGSVFAIEHYATTLVINNANGVRTPYEADGRTRLLRLGPRETVGVRAELHAHRLVVDMRWASGERLRLMFERRPGEERLTFTRVAVSQMLPEPISAVSVYERVSARAARKFAGLAALPPG